MARVLVLLAGLAWAAIVFVLSLWITFPGTAVAERLEWEVADSSGGAYALDLGDVGPWWVGLATDSAKLYTRPSPGDPANQLMMFATDARLAVGLTSLVWRQPRASGSVTIGEAGHLDYVVGTAMDADGKRLMVNEVFLQGDGFPVDDLLTVVPGADFTGTGAVDLIVDLDAPEGLSKANGTVRFGGKDVLLVNPVIMEFPLGRDVTLRELDLELEARDGKARITRGRLGSDVADIAITGDIVLADDIGRSRVDVRLELTLDPSMKMMEGMLASAAKDGKFVYRCVGLLNRIQYGCSPDGDKKVAGRTARTRPTSDRKTAPATLDGGEEIRRSAGLNEEERDKRRAELQERLRKRREQREADAGGAKRPGELEEVAPEEDLQPEEEQQEEEFVEEDLPIDEEIPEDEAFDE